MTALIARLQHSPIEPGLGGLSHRGDQHGTFVVVPLQGVNEQRVDKPLGHRPAPRVAFQHEVGPAVVAAVGLLAR